MTDMERRVIELEGSHDEIRSDIKIIKENHLAHIQIAVERLSSDMAWVKMIVTGTMMSVVGGIVALILNLKK